MLEQSGAEKLAVRAKETAQVAKEVTAGIVAFPRLPLPQIEALSEARFDLEAALKGVIVAQAAVEKDRA